MFENNLQKLLLFNQRMKIVMKRGILTGYRGCLKITNKNNSNSNTLENEWKRVQMWGIKDFEQTHC